VSVFTSDVFLEAFAPVIRGTPFLGHQMWVVRRGPVKMAYCSPWNGFIDDPNLAELIPVAKERECWALTFTSAGLLNDCRVEELSPVPTLIVSGDYSPSKKVRWSIKKALSIGFDVAAVPANVGYPVLSSLWGKLGRGIPLSFYQKLEGAGIGHTLVATLEGKPISALFHLADDDGARYMYSLATLEEHRHSQVTTLLVHRFLEEAFGSNAPFVDLCGCTEEPIYQFKSQFSNRVMFRPRYLHVIKKSLWKLVSWRSSTLYRDLVPSFIDDSNWKERIVRGLKS
jgi:hypothetical protein